MKAFVMFGLATITSFALIACSNEDQQSNNQEEENVQTEESQASGTQEKTDTGETLETSWEEVELVESELDQSFTDYQLVNDQGGSRVIHYLEGDRPQYKSIFIKEENRLKIVSMNEEGDGLIFNEVIDSNS